MYSWSDDMSDWRAPDAYKYSEKTKEARDVEAERAEAAGPRTYTKKREPNMQIVTPKKNIVSQSPNPLVVAVDVTGSMQTWPAEIFDRLPLLFNTLASYRPDLEVSFMAIGDAGCDQWPMQVTDFAKGFDLEERLKALVGEGGGGDEPESYGMLAYYIRHHVRVPQAQRPFLIVFGDATMHKRVPCKQLRHYLGDESVQDADALTLWQEVSLDWNTWFLRRPSGRPGDAVEKQWSEAIGAQQVVLMEDEQRAVDYAMGLIARSWGFFGDFQQNMRARQDDDKVKNLASKIEATKPRLVRCPNCSAALPPTARGRMSCGYCKATLDV